MVHITFFQAIIAAADMMQKIVPGHLLWWCCWISLPLFFNMINFLQNTHQTHPIAHLWGRDMGCMLGVQGLQPISQLFNCNLNLMEISFCSHLSFRYMIAIKFCTCRNSTAVMTCAKFCSDKIPYNGVSYIKTNFPSNLNYDRKIIHEMGPWIYILPLQLLYYKQHTAKIYHPKPSREAKILSSK